MTPLARRMRIHRNSTEDGYGWEKLYTEQLSQALPRGLGLETRVVRFHNIFGPLEL